MLIHERILLLIIKAFVKCAPCNSLICSNHIFHQSFLTLSNKVKTNKVFPTFQQSVYTFGLSVCPRSNSRKYSSNALKLIYVIIYLT